MCCRTRRVPARLGFSARCGAHADAPLKPQPFMDLFESQATVLRHPVWYSDTEHDEKALPLAVDDYIVSAPTVPQGRWTVTSSSGDVVYKGIGPVTVCVRPLADQPR